MVVTLRGGSLALLLAALPSCIGALGGSDNRSGDEGNDGGGKGITYYRDMLPVIQEKCGACHSAGGAGGFDLQSYDTARRFSAAMAAATATGRMPPWPPSATCGDFLGREERTLTAEQAQQFSEWDSAGAPAGDPADAPAPRQIPADAPPDLELDAGGDYTFANNQADLYWCFRLPRANATLDVIGADILPGNKASVHHVLVFRELGGGGEATGLPGFECGGIPARSEILFGWAPGGRPLRFPAGAGVRVEPQDGLIMQIHYHTVAGAGPLQDRTRLQLYTAKAALTDLVKVVWTGTALISMAPGASASLTGTCAVPANSGPVKVLASSPHMHTLGTNTKTTVVRADGSQNCLVDIPRWDFEWQGGYSYREPVVLQPGDEIRTTCSFKNTSQNQVQFGEGTGDEMCFNFLFVIGGNLPPLCFPPCNAGGCNI